MVEEDPKYLRAKERVHEIKRVYVHFFIYLVVNMGLIAINLITTPKQLWFYWPLAGWGLGLFAHAFSVFIIGGLLGKDWEEKKIQKIVAKLEQKDKQP